jgi:glyoxylase-like metal-dependent hydrolase (beta-lactamase superfamily II)
MKVLACIAVIALSGAIFAATGAGQSQAQPVTVQPLKGGIYFLKGGSGANGGFFVGAKGVVVIDARMTAAAAREMIAEIRKVTPLPVTHVILTHSDLDHVNGLGGFPAGLEITLKPEKTWRRPSARTRPSSRSSPTCPLGRSRPIPT